MLDLWERKVVAFLSDIGFNLLNSPWSHFVFHYVANVLSWWKVWTAGRPLQHPNSSTTKTCSYNRLSMRSSVVLVKYAKHCPKKMLSGREHVVF